MIASPASRLPNARNINDRAQTEELRFFVVERLRRCADGRERWEKPVLAEVEFPSDDDLLNGRRLGLYLADREGAQTRDTPLRREAEDRRPLVDGLDVSLADLPSKDGKKVSACLHSGGLAIRTTDRSW